MSNKWNFVKLLQFWVKWHFIKNQIFPVGESLKIRFLIKCQPLKVCPKVHIRPIESFTWYNNQQLGFCKIWKHFSIFSLTKEKLSFKGKLKKNKNSELIFVFSVLKCGISVDFIYLYYFYKCSIKIIIIWIWKPKIEIIASDRQRTFEIYYLGRT